MSRSGESYVSVFTWVPWPKPARVEPSGRLALLIPTAAVPRTLTVRGFAGALRKDGRPSGTYVYSLECEQATLRLEQGPCATQPLGKGFLLTLPVEQVDRISADATRMKLRSKDPENLAIVWGTWLFSLTDLLSRERER